MAIPLLLIGAAAAVGITGVVKGAKAVGDFSEAKEIGETAERKHRRKLRDLERVRERVNQECEALGRLKIEIFNHQIKHVVSVLKQSKSAGSKLKDYNSYFSIEDMKEMEKMISIADTFVTGSIGGTAKGVIAGGLTGLAVYGTAPFVASASTGTAIATLSGVAAKNATLAWLGGGSLATGGLGIAGGTMVLGGLVAGPALAIAGFVLASKAEEALTQAYEYRAQVNEAIAQIELIETGLEGVSKNVKFVRETLLSLVERFEQVKTTRLDDHNVEKMLLVGRSIKSLLEEKIMQDDGMPTLNIRQTCSGYLEI